MGVLPARRIALGALCAALLAGVTGPAAMAADTVPGRDRAVSSTALLAQVRTIDAREHGLTPVVDLVTAVLEADDGRLPSGEARRLGEAAKAAVVRAADDDPAATAAVTTEPSPSAATADDTVLVTEDDLTSEEIAALREALDELLELLAPDTAANTEAETDTDAETETEAAEETDDATEETDATTETDAATEADDAAADAIAQAEADANAAVAEATSTVDEVLARVDELVAALLGTEPTASTLPAPADPARTPLLPGVTLPALTSVLVPPSS